MTSTTAPALPANYAAAQEVVASLALANVPNAAINMNTGRVTFYGYDEAAVGRAVRVAFYFDAAVRATTAPNLYEIV